MTKIALIFLLFFCSANAQQSEKTYFGEFENHSTIYSYNVTEISISSDSVLTRYDYKLPNKKEWKNYKSYDPKITISKIHKTGEYFTLDEIEGETRLYKPFLKITDNNLTFYFLDEKRFTKIWKLKRKK